MSSSSSQVYSDDDENLSIGFSARLGISLGVLSLMVLLAVVTYFWERTRGLFRHHPPAAAAGNSDDGGGGGGMSMEELEGVMVVDGSGDFQKIQFSQAKVSDVVGTCCSICLVDYKEDDWLLQLPHCRHMFHVDCVRVWLCLNGTCPVCRTSLPPRHRSTTSTTTTTN